jgi:hypothetical protein
VIARKRARDVALGREPSDEVDPTVDRKTSLAPVASPGHTSAMQRRKRKTFTDQVRAEVLNKRRHGMTRYRIAKLLDTSEGSLHGFASGRFGISSPLLDRLADLLGLRVVVDDRRQPTKQSGRRSPARHKHGDEK